MRVCLHRTKCDWWRFCWIHEQSSVYCRLKPTVVAPRVFRCYPCRWCRSFSVLVLFLVCTQQQQRLMCDKSNPIGSTAFAFMVITVSQTPLYNCISCVEDYELTKSKRTPRHTNTHSRSLSRTDWHRRAAHTQTFQLFSLGVCVWVSVWAEIARAVCAHCCKTQNIHTAVAE